MNEKEINNITFLTVYVVSGILLLGIIQNNLNSLPPDGTPRNAEPAPENTSGPSPQDMETPGLKLHEALYWKTVE